MNMITADFFLQRRDHALDVKFNIPSQGTTGIFGPSGAGKTSLLRCIAGLEPRAKGRFHINHTCWQDSATNYFLPTHKRSLGYVFQERYLFSHLNVRENLLYGYRRAKKANPVLDFDQIVHWMDLQPLLNCNVSSLSGGEQQRIAIARALLRSPDILLLDEPVSSLDSQGKQSVLTCLERLQREMNLPIVYVTHSQEELARMADYILLIDNGKVHTAGRAHEILPKLDLTITKVLLCENCLTRRVII